jgi:UDP-N-acetylglucosamine 4-epimerase
MNSKKFHEGELRNYSFLVTGGAGFIGSHLVDYLVQNGAGKVRVLDNFSNGRRVNLEAASGNPALEIVEGDIRNYETCLLACREMDYVLHQAAVGSVPRSIKDPLYTHEVNATGTLNIFKACTEEKIKRIIYASSSSVYGDSEKLPKIESDTGNLLSPYAVSKAVNEMYAGVFSTAYKLEVFGLRYFNVFGPRQNPDDPYAAVIPIFIDQLRKMTAPSIFGDGSQTRDFTYVENVVQANIRCLFQNDSKHSGMVYNVAAGKRISINELFKLLKSHFQFHGSALYVPPRKGDIEHSLADITLALAHFQYKPLTDFESGIKQLLS